MKENLMIIHFFWSKHSKGPKRLGTCCLFYLFGYLRRLRQPAKPKKDATPIRAREQFWWVAGLFFVVDFVVNVVVYGMRP
jgi:hypothetical protein